MGSFLVSRLQMQTAKTPIIMQFFAHPKFSEDKTILVTVTASVAGKFKLICKYLLCLDLLCQIKSVIFAKSICSGMD